MIVGVGHQDLEVVAHFGVVVAEPPQPGWVFFRRARKGRAPCTWRRSTDGSRARRSSSRTVSGAFPGLSQFFPEGSTTSWQLREGGLRLSQCSPKLAAWLWRRVPPPRARGNPSRAAKLQLRAGGIPAGPELSRFWILDSGFPDPQPQGRYSCPCSSGLSRTLREGKHPWQGTGHRRLGRARCGSSQSGSRFSCAVLGGLGGVHGVGIQGFGAWNVGRGLGCSPAGSEIDCADKYGNTPLHVAARYGHELLISTLMTNGADTAR